MTTTQRTSTRSSLEIVKDAVRRSGREIKEWTGKWGKGEVCYHRTNCPGPNHKNGDQNPSLDFWEVTNDEGKTTVFFQCRSGNCSRQDILQALSIKGALVPGAPTYHNKRPIVTLHDLEKHTLLDWHLLFGLGWQDGTATFHTENGRSYTERGVIIPYYRQDGTEMEQAKIRLALEKTDDKTNPRFKWTEGDKEDGPVAYGLQHLDKAREAGYVVIVEGESDFATLYTYGIPALGIPGTSNIKKALTPGLLDGIPCVYVIQEKTDQAGKNFPYDVKRHLLEIRYTGKILRVPLRNLTDDKDPNALHKRLYRELKETGNLKTLVARFTEEFQKALDQARPMDHDTGQQQDQSELDTKALDKAIAEKDRFALLKQCSVLAQLSRVELMAYKMRIKDAFEKDINLNELSAAINEARQMGGQEKGDRVDMTVVAQIFAERHGDTYRFSKEEQCWYQWIGTHWQELQKNKGGKHEIDRLLRPIIHEMGFDITSNSLLECAHRLCEGDCEGRIIAASNLINFTNGTLDITTMELHEHNRDNGLTSCLDYAYDPTMPHPTIGAFLQETLCKKELGKDGRKVPDWHAIQAYMAHLGLAMIGDTAMNLFEILYGSPRAGKTTLMRLGNAACGIVVPFETTPEKRYSSFAGDDLFTNDLEGKRARFMRRSYKLVCADELSPEALAQDEMIKNMSGHSGVSMRGMNKDDVTSNTWIGKLIMSTNNLPSYLDYSGAVKERVIYLHTPFKRERDQRDLKLLGKLVAELPGFAHTCITLALKALERGYYPQSISMKALANAAEHNGNAMKAFIEDCCVLDEKAIIPSEVLYKRFIAYREANGHTKNYTQQTMTANLKNMNIGVHNNDGKAYRYTGMHDGQPYSNEPTRCLFGIRLREAHEGRVDVTLEDDGLLAPELCNAVTGCNGPVTDHRYKNDSASNGSTSHFSDSNGTACNDVTDFSQKLDKETPTFDGVTPESEKDMQGRWSIKGNTFSKNPVTPLQRSMNEPVEPSQTCNASSEGPLQSPLQEEFRAIYSQLEAVALNDVEWNISLNGYGRGTVTGDEYKLRMRELFTGGDEAKIRAGIVDMEKHLPDHGRATV